MLTADSGMRSIDFWSESNVNHPDLPGLNISSIIELIACKTLSESGDGNACRD
jgi:hypothetical protein